MYEARAFPSWLVSLGKGLGLDKDVVNMKILLFKKTYDFWGMNRRVHPQLLDDCWHAFGGGGGRVTSSWGGRCTIAVGSAVAVAVAVVGVDRWVVHVRKKELELSFQVQHTCERNHMTYSGLFQVFDSRTTAMTTMQQDTTRGMGGTMTMVGGGNEDATSKHAADMKDMGGMRAWEPLCISTGSFFIYCITLCWY